MNIVINKLVDHIEPGDSLVLNGISVGVNVESTDRNGDAFRIRVRGMKETYLVPAGTLVALCLPPEHRRGR